jgi:hypothetical protein
MAVRRRMMTLRLIITEHVAGFDFAHLDESMCAYRFPSSRCATFDATGALQTHQVCAANHHTAQPQMSVIHNARSITASD